MSKLLREHDEMITAALKKAEQLGVYLVLRINQNDKFTLDWRDAAIEKITVANLSGVGLYAFTKQGHVAFGASSDMKTADIVRLVENVAAIAKANQAAGTDQASEIYELPKQENLGEDALHYNVVDVASIDQRSVSNYARAVETFIHKQSKNVRATMSVNFEQVQWRIVRSDGTDVDFAIPYARTILNMTLREKNKTVAGAVRLFSPSLDGLISDTSGYQAAIRHELKLARQQLDAAMITDPGNNKAILIAGDLGGTLVHEALGHPAESDAVAENASVLGDEGNLFVTGTQVAAKGVAVVDHEEGLNHGFHPYGIFGNKREPVTIIEDGVLKESLSDVFSAHKTGVANKNTERSENYSMVAIPRMSTTYIKLDQELLLEPELPSSEPEAVRDLLKKHGVFNKHPLVYYLIGFRGGSVSPKTGNFMFGSGYTYELSEDSVTTTVPASFSGDVLEALKSIEFGVGEVHTDDYGYCGKAGQRAFVSDGGHELLFFAPNKHVSIA